MRFRLYLEQLLGTKAGICILRSLVRCKGKNFTVRELGRNSGVSNVEASRTINQLKQFGIVKVQPVGKAYQISLNDKSYVLNKIVKPIFMAEEKTISELIAILKKHLTRKKIISVVVFGSVAKGGKKEDSNVDLLVVVDDFDNATEAIEDASKDVDIIFHTKISPTIFTRKEFTSRKNIDLVRTIQSCHIQVTGIALEKLK